MDSNMHNPSEQLLNAGQDQVQFTTASTQDGHATASTETIALIENDSNGHMFDSPASLVDGHHNFGSYPFTTFDFSEFENTLQTQAMNVIQEDPKPAPSSDHAGVSARSLLPGHQVRNDTTGQGAYPIVDLASPAPTSHTYSIPPNPVTHNNRECKCHVQTQLILEMQKMLSTRMDNIQSHTAGVLNTIYDLNKGVLDLLLKAQETFVMLGQRGQ